MANRLAFDKTQGIMKLFAAGMSKRQIARTLDIDRKSVDRELRLQGAKGGNLLNAGILPRTKACERSLLKRQMTKGLTKKR
jgi:IS30 family transposase